MSQAAAGEHWDDSESVFGAAAGQAAHYVEGEFHALAGHFAIPALLTSSHCPRVGTCSILVKMGLPLYVLNGHLGWVAGSSMVDVYYRSYVQPTEFDKLFLWGAMPEVI